MAKGRIHGLDGLRAFAVVAVVAYHLWPDAFPGGFVGVDVFFVISGFLITTLLLREHRASGGIAFRSFWIRRARRLLPALVTVVTVSIAAALIVDADLLVGAPRQVLGALTFSTNWVEAAAGSKYFDHSTPTLFLTFWSLAVEEQFYLLWPAAFAAVAASRIRSATMARVTIWAALTSALLMVVWRWAGATTTRVYYGTDTHLFGLMLGAALAYGFAGGFRILSHPRWQRLRVWIGFVGMAAVACLTFGLSGESGFTYPHGLLMASLAASLMVAALPGAPTLFVRLNRLGPLEWIGTRSYGIYLWHWPVILVATQILSPGTSDANSTPWVAAVAIGATAGLAELTFRFVETPIRRDGFGASLQRFRGALVDRDDTRRAGGARVAAAAACSVLVVAMAGVAFAPDRSDAEQSVTAGLDAIARQAATTRPTGDAPSTTPSTIPTGPAWPPDQPVPSGELMTGLGDSVMSGAAPALYRRFPGIQLDAKPIRQWKDAPALAKRAIQDGRMRRVVVLNFGTNAGLFEDHSKEALREVLEILGPNRRVVIFDVVGVSRWVPSTNETLRAIAADHPNVAVAEWNKVVNSFAGLLHRDRTHPNMRGIEAYAELLSQTLTALGPGS